VPYFKQYVIGLDQFFQRFVSMETAEELSLTWPANRFSEEPFPGVTLLDSDPAWNAISILWPRELPVPLFEGEVGSRKMVTARPPHFPDPNVDPIALLEQALRDKDEIIADQHRELTAWRTQLEVALERIKEYEASRGKV
jgi:hypothetical protein